MYAIRSYYVFRIHENSRVLSPVFKLRKAVKNLSFCIAYPGKVMDTVCNSGNFFCKLGKLFFGNITMQPADTVYCTIHLHGEFSKVVKRRVFLVSGQYAKNPSADRMAQAGIQSFTETIMSCFNRRIV